MSGLPFAFAYPPILFALLALPLIWLLLRVTPPKPRTESFPPTRLLLEIAPKEETPARTPWWLILLRCLIAAALIIALAGPIYRPTTEQAPGAGPLLLVVDNGWASAPNWKAMGETARRIIGLAEEAGRPIAIVATADGPGQELAPDRRRPRSGAGSKRWRRAHTRRTMPRCFRRSTRRPAPTPSAAWSGSPTASPVRAAIRFATFLTQRIDGPLVALRRFQRRGRRAEAAGRRRRCAGRAGDPKQAGPAGRRLRPRHRPPRPEHRGRTVRFRGRAERDRGADRAACRTSERHRPARHRRHRDRRRGPAPRRPLAPPADRASLRRDRRHGAAAPLAALLHRPRRPALRRRVRAARRQRRHRRPGDDRRRRLGHRHGRHRHAAAATSRSGWRNGSRKAARWSASPDRISPSPPTRSSRSGSATATASSAGASPGRSNSRWRRSPSRAPSPAWRFPNDVLVKRQVLAEPDGTLAERTWAALADGTPLVTAAPSGKGWVILFHVTADAGWSNLPLSGTFVDMLRRIVAFSSVSARQRRPVRPAIRAADCALSPARRLRPLRQSRPRGPADSRQCHGRCARHRSIRRVSTAARPASVSLNLLDADAMLRPFEPSLVAGRRCRALSDRSTHRLPTMAACGRPRPVPPRCARRPLAERRLGFDRRAATADDLLDRRRGARIAVAGAARRAGRRGERPVRASRPSRKTHLAYVITGNDEIDRRPAPGSPACRGCLPSAPRSSRAIRSASIRHATSSSFFPLLYWPIDPASADAVLDHHGQDRRLYAPGRLGAVRHPRPARTLHQRQHLHRHAGGRAAPRDARRASTSRRSSRCRPTMS